MEQVAIKFEELMNESWPPKWWQEEFILDFSDFIRLPIMAQYTLGHIHERGVCKKNRYGPHCGADNGN